jgi:NAD+ synthase
MDLTLDYPIIKNNLVGFIRNELSRANLKTGIVGLSGGIDSALTAFLTAEALGPENTYCIMMPYKTSNPNSRAHAELVVNQLKCKSELVEITPMVEPLFAMDKDITPLRKGNIMARERMIVLYDRSSKYNGLVIGTSNKTETLLGYATMYGDNACAINPIGELYKTQVWQFAEYLGIPQELINKAPSADLWDGQTDEKELGFTYKEIDKFFYQMVDEKKSITELLKSGYEQSFIDRVNNRIESTQYKRRMPIVAKLS